VVAMPTPSRVNPILRRPLRASLSESSRPVVVLRTTKSERCKPRARAAMGRQSAEGLRSRARTTKRCGAGPTMKKG